MSRLMFTLNFYAPNRPPFALFAGLALALTGSAQTAEAAGKLPEPVTLSSGWLMQDAARGQGDRGGHFPGRLCPGGLSTGRLCSTATADANPPSATVPEALRFAPRGPRDGQGDSPVAMAEGWPLNPEPNRPSFSSGWVQAPAPAAPAWYPATVPGTVLTTLVNNHVYPEPLYGENNRPNIIPESLARAAYWYRTDFAVPAAFAGRQIWLNFDGINYTADVWVNGAPVGTIRGAFVYAATST